MPFFDYHITTLFNHLLHLPQIVLLDFPILIIILLIIKYIYNIEIVMWYVVMW